MAAIGVASRVASEQNTQLGERVGYQIKGENKSSLNTSIVFMTTGILIQIISHIPAHKPLP
jgi:HrpA-like helicases